MAGAKNLKIFFLHIASCFIALSGKCGHYTSHVEGMSLADDFWGQGSGTVHT